ncbi:MAG: 23S rRNA (pseudouridine(1915)-N(3))-methyltransferase RlmH [Desulfuromonadaceae bacterium]|nr:23S rRNA (pseudouridine(1915)-N(3))-methyltransferase RlmH [Desulfuromonadaceae bacterium]
MKLRLTCVGKLAESFTRDGVAEYAQRVKRYFPLQIDEHKEEKGGKKADPRYIRECEGARLLAKIPPEATVVVLDENGRQQRSTELADWMEKQMSAGTGEIVWVIGGAYGLSDAVKARANLLLSLSAMTLPHQLVRLLLLEQLYRSLTIIRHEPYHNP